MTIYAYDTEFLEQSRTIDLISIGIVAEDGREYYAVTNTLPIDAILADNWMLANVWRHLPLEGHKGHELTVDGETQYVTTSVGKLDLTSEFVKPTWVIRNEVRAFLLNGVSEENPVSLWADYAAYDHIILAKLFGKMSQLPEGIPMFTNDLQTLFGLRIAPEPGEAIAHVHVGAEHNALDDARTVMQSLQFLGVAKGDASLGRS